ncbi:MAG: hypothetical protein RL328_1737 [Acidobacteriota bacterium]|jgi:hypothetical protein
MRDRRTFGQTFLLSGFDEGATATPLIEVPLEKTPGKDARYGEAWLQDLLMRHPSLLPVNQIEPAYEDMEPICRELPMSSEGFLDNLFVTTNGDLALVECKLWRNPEARREVVAQILGYAKDIAAWSYEQLEGAINKTRPLPGHPPRRKLYELVASEMDEAAFHDAVERNLQRGRFLLLVVGDGIQERMEAMADFLQEHAGFHFTLAFVEIALFEAPPIGFVAQPRLLAKTQNIVRAIVKIEDGRISVTSPERAPGSAAPAARETGITQETFLESLEQNFPGVTPKLQNFFDDLREVSVHPQFGKETLILRWIPERGSPWNIATISRKGAIWTDYMGQQAKKLGLGAAHKQYLRDLAALIPGATVRETPKDPAWYVSINRDYLKISTLLADEEIRNGWIEAIKRFEQSIPRESEE